MVPLATRGKLVPATLRSGSKAEDGEAKMSFDEVRDSLVISFAEGLITDEEFLFLYEEYESVNPFYPYWEFELFCLDSLDSSECKSKHCTRAIFPQKRNSFKRN